MKPDAANCSFCLKNEIEISGTSLITFWQTCLTSGSRLMTYVWPCGWLAVFAFWIFADGFCSGEGNGRSRGWRCVCVLRGRGGGVVSAATKGKMPTMYFTSHLVYCWSLRVHRKNLLFPGWWGCVDVELQVSWLCLLRCTAGDRVSYSLHII